ncbi:NECAP endocytosis associated 2 [Fimicolochytrium jonesii]|uniref:NECAP endocytosis associated 2 n=1 Tax=Fimicolochytrium jonesii TaxID=1396493 RepID=UPI0022FDCF6F|nr:NECAP endocytosis associated 2 [Fimicolochytrium jonesii]KAI8819895.1 NECAP endocytosis associated 2 [Fimicolochytrium jonesii]
MADDYESVLLVIKEVMVYRVPPRQTSRGYRASDWDETQHLWSGRLRITATATKATIRLEDSNTGELFAIAPYDPAGQTVESVNDSSRYFVLRIVDPASKQHAFVGLGFPERGWAFDFNVALQDFSSRLKRDSTPSAARVVEGPKVDYSLKEGQTISINIGNSSAKSVSRPQEQRTNPSLPFLPPPPSAQSKRTEAPSNSTASAFGTPASQPQQNNEWADFVGFGASSQPQPSSSQAPPLFDTAWPNTSQQQQEQTKPSASSGSVPTSWTTF